MKKLSALILAVLLALTLSATCFAEEEPHEVWLVVGAQLDGWHDTMSEERMVFTESGEYTINAFFFGLTGTPINKLDKNTFRTFGAEQDKSGYMSRYSFADSIRDGATLPLNFEPVPVELHVNQEVVDAEFDRMAEQAGLTAREKSDVARRVRMEAIMKSPDRIQKVCEHIVNHFLTKVDPNGFKGQVVCYDRESCVLYKKAIDKLLGDDHYTTIVMDTNNDKEDKYKEWRRDRDEEGKLLDRFRDPNDPLKLVIVTAKLLTGFDAPILQVMYLDKPMKDHRNYP